MERKQLTIGLFGFGCVGLGLYEVLQKTPALCAHIKKICVKHPGKPRTVGHDRLTYNREDILNDADINVVVELIDDADAAFEIVKDALKKGKAVVSANKKMIAENLEELLRLQKLHNTPFLYEAACCASIPIIRNLEEYYDNDLLQSLEGIVNGSTNYILTKTATDNLSYAEALKQAQQLGYAESDPRLDTEGFDAKYKLVILVAHAFGLVLEPGDVFNLGINRLQETELRYAAGKHLKIKLVAHAFRNSEGKTGALVLPQFVDTSNKLYWTDGVFNGVKTCSVFSDSQFFVGKGAGAHPTASAVISDISALTYGYRYEYKKLGQSAGKLKDSEVWLNLLVRTTGSADKIRHYFAQVEEEYSRHNASYVIGQMQLHKLVELNARFGEAVSVVLTESPTPLQEQAQSALLHTEWR